MANHCRITQAAANAMCNALVDLADAGTPPGLIKVYTGSEPANCDAAAGTLVSTCTLASPAGWGAAAWSSGDSASKASLTSTATDSNCTGSTAAVTYFRVTNAAGTATLQGTIGTSSADLNLNTTTIAAGSQLDITQLDVLVPINQA